MSLPGHPNAELDVVTTVTHVLDAFEQMVETELADEKVDAVYDEQLTFETGIRSYIDKNNYEQQPKTNYPVFLYTRGPLHWPKGVAPSRRLNNLTGFLRILDADKKPQGSVNYVASQNEFDIQFMYLCRSVEQQEQFEVAHQSETGISANRTLTLKIGDIGDFNYYLTYTDLVQKVINYENSAYVATMGSITVRGMYFTFTGASNLIKQINLNVFLKVNVTPRLKGDLTGLVLNKVLT